MRIALHCIERCCVAACEQPSTALKDSRCRQQLQRVHKALHLACLIN